LVRGVLCCLNIIWESYSFCIYSLFKWVIWG
jgi:hypothetical protein